MQWSGGRCLVGCFLAVQAGDSEGEEHPRDAITSRRIAVCSADKVEEALDELAVCGPQLGRPLVDRIHGSKIHNLKELRPRVPGNAEVRLLFVFDPEREAIVLVAGNKAGRWNAWYAEVIPLAEGHYAAYRREAGEEEE